MSIKTRLLISNIIMIFIVVAFLAVFMFFMIRIYLSDYTLPTADYVYSETLSSFSLTDLQVVVDDVKDSLDSGGDISGSPDYKDIKKFLDRTGTSLLIQNENGLVFCSDQDEDKYGAILSGAFAYNEADATTNTVLYADHSNMVCRVNVDDNDGTFTTLLFINDKASMQTESSGIRIFSADLRSKTTNQMRLIALISIAAVVAINLVIVFFISRSVLKPLQMLKKGTQMISEGNYDFEIKYKGDDEISDVIRNFDDMRKKLQASQEQQRKYEDSRKELLAGISHDLSTPLTSIKGYVSGLMDGVADTPEKQDKYLRTIYNTTEDMDRLVSDLFMFSKLDVDKVPFSFEKLDFGAYISDIIEEMKFSFEKDDLCVEFISDLKKPVMAYIDRAQFARVLLNIARNSIKYRKGDRACLYTELSLEEDGKTIKLVMRDDGIGVSGDAVGKIFDSFYRSDPARTNTASGSGLGLAIAKQIVDRHHGTIGAESEPGEGLTITIRLPAAETRAGDEA